MDSLVCRVVEQDSFQCDRIEEFQHGLRGIRQEVGKDRSGNTEVEERDFKGFRVDYELARLSIGLTLSKKLDTLSID